MLTPVLSWIVLLFSSWVPTLMAPPIAGLSAKDLHDTFDQRRGLAKHEAIDIMEPRGTPVRAVVDGTIAKLFLSKRGGNTIYLFDGDGVFCYYYGHLDHYASNLHEGMRVSHGQVIAYVGSTGDADPSAPHLHFTIFKLGPERHWWRGTPINPYPALIHLLSVCCPAPPWRPGMVGTPQWLSDRTLGFLFLLGNLRSRFARLAQGNGHGLLPAFDLLAAADIVLH